MRRLGMGFWGWMAGATLLAGLIAGSSGARADDAAEPELAARVKKLVGDKPFAMIVIMKIKPSEAARFEAAAMKSVAATRKEPGNVLYELHKDSETPGGYYFLEKWKNPKALATHLQADYVKTLLGTVAEISAEPPTIKFVTAVEPK